MENKTFTKKEFDSATNELVKIARESINKGFSSSISLFKDLPDGNHRHGAGKKGLFHFFLYTKSNNTNIQTKLTISKPMDEIK